MKIYIPSESLDNHIAFLGGTGSGKTSATKANIVEPALAASKRVIILDPTGGALFRSWLSKSSKCEAEIMTVLHGSRRAMTKLEIAQGTPSNYAVDGGGFNNALGRLRSLELIKGYESIVLSPDLF